MRRIVGSVVVALLSMAGVQVFATPLPTADIQAGGGSVVTGTSFQDHLTSDTSGLTYSNSAGFASCSAVVNGGASPSVSVISSAAGLTTNNGMTYNSSNAGASAQYTWWFRIVDPFVADGTRIPVNYSDTLGYAASSTDGAYWQGSAAFRINDVIINEASLGWYASSPYDAQIGSHSGQITVFNNAWNKAYITASAGTRGDFSTQTVSLSVYVDPTFTIDDSWLQAHPLDGTNMEFATVAPEPTAAFLLAFAATGLLRRKCRRARSPFYPPSDPHHTAGHAPRWS